MTEIKKYYLFDNDDLIGCFTADEISEMIGCTKKIVYGYAGDGRAYKFRYTFESTDNDELFYEEWNKARFAILNAEVKPKKVTIKKHFSIWKQPKRRLRRYINK